MAVAGFVITCSSCRVLSISFLNDDTHACRVCVDCLHQAMQVIQKRETRHLSSLLHLCTHGSGPLRQHSVWQSLPSVWQHQFGKCRHECTCIVRRAMPQTLVPKSFFCRDNPSNTQCQRAEMNRTTEKIAVGEHSEQVRAHTGCKTSAKNDHAANLHTVTLMAPIGMRPRKRL